MNTTYCSVKWWVLGCALQNHLQAVGFLLAAPLRFLTEWCKAEARHQRHSSSMMIPGRVNTQRIRNCFVVAPAIPRSNHLFSRRPPC
jgi:hypothetical protein